MFKFSLEAVLQVRSRKLEQAQLSLAESLRAIREIEDRLARVDWRRRTGNEEMHRRSGEGISADEFILRRMYLNGLLAQSRQLKEELQKCRETAEKKRRELVAADKEKKMVERLKEQAYIRYGQEAKARETKALDEFAVIGFARARRMENG